MDNALKVLFSVVLLIVSKKLSNNFKLVKFNGVQVLIEIDFGYSLLYHSNDLKYSPISLFIWEIIYYFYNDGINFIMP